MLQSKLKKLKDILINKRRVAIAFSGGVDSTFLLWCAVDTLGADRVLALTADSPLFPRHELAETTQITRKWGVQHLVLQGVEMENPDIVNNGPRRCYYCKHALFSHFLEQSSRAGFSHLAEGSNTDDLNDYRPGRQALSELSVSSPLLEARLSKKDIRDLSRLNNLETWNKPSWACLASRIPYGTPITRENLARVERCEAFLRLRGFSNFRVRDHGETARIEAPPTELAHFLKEPFRTNLVAAFKEAGFTYIALDLEGYRTGSLNETLS